MVLTVIKYFLLGYLIGAIPFAFLVGLVKGGNIYKQGSGNPGATNTLVVFGKAAGAVVLVLDVLKGFLPTLLVLHFTGDTSLAFWTGTGAVTGHVASIYTKFRGGKALASAGGVLLCLYPIPLIVVVVSYVALLFLTRYIVLATTLVVVGAVVFFLSIGQPLTKDLALMVMVLGVLFRHLPNWERMYLRNEPKVGQPVHEITLERLPKRKQRLVQVVYLVVCALAMAMVAYFKQGMA
ncbi:MAG: glycerol-3-phosphate 1-O-acyltransferase PlsY [Tumebacillaceae bacterium]